MKIKTELEIDFIESYEGEEIEIDEIVKRDIIRKVTNEIYAKINKTLEAKVLKSIERRMDTYINKFIKRIMKSKIQITEGWESEGTELDKIFKKKIKTALEDEVTEKGNVPDYRHKAVGTRMEFITGDIIDRKLNDLVKQTSFDIDKKVRDIFAEQIKSRIVDNFTTNILKNIDIGKMLNVGG